MTRSEETFDALFNGQIALYQSVAGYRFSLDALLLAHFVTIKPETASLHWSSLTFIHRLH